MEIAEACYFPSCFLHWSATAFAHWRLLLNDIDIESRFIDLRPFFPSSSSSSSFLMICETLRDYIHSLLINRYYFRTRKLLFRKLKLCITMRLTAERQQIFWLMNSIDTPPFFFFFLLVFFNSNNLDVGSFIHSLLINIIFT